MSKSKIIQDLTSGVCSLPVALKRLYVILSDLDDDELQSWVRKELNGYSNQDKIPAYREVRCIPTGTYEVVGYGKIFTYSNKPLPMIDFDEELKKELTYNNLSMSIEAINQALARYKDGTSIGIPIPMGIWHLFQKGTNITVTGASSIIDESEVQRVLSNIESKVLDLLLYLEKKFGNLDDLDISADDYNKSYLQNVVKSCKQIVFENCTFQSFDNTKIKAKNFATGNSKVDDNKTINKNKNSNTGEGNNYIEKHLDIKSEVNVKTIQEQEKKECWIKKLFKKRRRM